MTSQHPPTYPPFPPAEPEPEYHPPRAHRRQAKRRRSWEFNPWLWAAVALLILGGLVGYFLLRDPSPPTTPAGAPIVTTTPSATPVTPAYDLPEGSFAGDGGLGDAVQVYVVGKHIQPGTYTTAGALDPARAGHWERLQFRTEGDVPRRVRGGEVVGPQTVTLEIGDIFETRGFKPWNPAPEE